jgi:hypothetical protein
MRRSLEEATMRLRLTLCAPLLAGCLYTNIEQPLSYRSPTPIDVAPAPLGPDSADGEACNHIILFLVAFGDGGYRAAVDDAVQKSGAKMLADVKADNSFMNVVGVYQRSCTRVRGRIVR